MTLFGKRVFANVIMLRILRWDNPGLSWGALNPLASALRRTRQRRFETEEEETEQRQRLKSRNTSSCWKLWGREWIFPYRTQRRWPYRHLDLGLLAFGTLRQCTSVILSHQVVVIWTSSPRKLMHTSSWLGSAKKKCSTKLLGRLSVLYTVESRVTH